MAMDLSNQTYQPVNLGSGMTEAFKAGTGVYSDLASNVRALLQTGMGEEGAMRRTQVSERGAMARAQLSETGAKERSLIAAGFGPTGKGLTLDDILKMREKLPGTATLKAKLATGEEIGLAGSKFSDDEVLDARAQKLIEAWIKTPEGMSAKPEDIMAAFFTVRQALSEGKLPEMQVKSQAPGLGANIWGGLKSIGSGIMNLGVPSAFAAGNPAINAGANVAGRTNQYSQLVEEAKRRGLMK